MLGTFTCAARPCNWAVPLFMALLMVGSCRAPDEDLGLDLLPGDPLGVLVDTTTLKAYSFQDTVIRTSGLTRNMLGSYFDPQFGLVNAGIVTQLRLSSNNVGAGQDNSGLVADSLVLALAFDGINYAYGNLNAQIFRVHELGESLSLDSVYYSDDAPVVFQGDLVANRGGRIVPRPLTKPFIGGDSLQPQLRIRLDRQLADRFISAFGTPDMVDNAAFLEYFKGLYITVDNGAQLPFQQGILYFALLNVASKATLYYHDDNNEPELLRSFDLLIDQGSARYTTVEHDRGQALDPRLSLALADTSAPASVTFVQALGGVRTGIIFPNILDYSGRGLILAKAELIIPLDGTFNAYHPPPNQLFIFRKDTAGKDVFLPDQLGGLGAIDGNYRADDREYRFNITRYIQGLLNGSITGNNVTLVPGSNGVTANRAVLAGPDRSYEPMRLDLIFSTY